MKITKISALCIIINVLLGLDVVALASIHVGYKYYDYQGYPPPNGVAADIKTINQAIPYGSNFYTQSVTAYTSVTHGYFIQVGYYKGFNWNGVRKWYVERYDSNGGPYHDWNATPTTGTTYHYYLDRTAGGSTWSCGVDGQFNYDHSMSPYSPRNYEAVSEMTTNAQVIDGTYYKYIYYAQGSDWRLWTRHVAVNEDPIVYTLSQPYHYRFRASGGGE